MPFLAEQIVIPLIKSLSTSYPDIAIDLDLSENFIDLIDSNIDIAIRIDSAPIDSGLVYKKLIPNNLICCATPKYISSLDKALKTPKDLKTHKILALEIHKKCRFGRSEVTVGDLLSSKLVTTENGSFLQKLALNHLGILVRSEIEVRSLINSGHLVPVLINYPLDSFGNVYAVIPSRRLLAPRVSKIIELIEEITKKMN